MASIKQAQQKFERANNKHALKMDRLNKAFEEVNQTRTELHQAHADLLAALGNGSGASNKAANPTRAGGTRAHATKANAGENSGENS